MHCIGMMQGRLLPKVGDRIQAFPGKGWEREFSIAAELGFDCIELTIEMASWETHPVRTPDGRKKLHRVAAESGVTLAGLCCDTVMEAPLVDADKDIRDRAASDLDALMRDAAAAELPMVELPMMGSNSLAKGAAVDAFGLVLDRALDLAETEGIDILLETDLAPAPFAEFMRRHAHPRLGINYDMGNSTWFGFDPHEEIAAYHAHIRNVHVKDCTRADYSVPLGTGETDMETVFSLLARHSYTGDFILQAARGEDDIAVARGYHGLVHGLVDRAFTRKAASTAGLAS